MGRPTQPSWVPCPGGAASNAIVQKELEVMIVGEGWAESFLYVLLGVTVVIGLAAGMATRLSIGTRLEGVWQYGFLGSLGLVGGTTVAVLIFAPELWLVPAVGLAAMILVATCDFGSSRRAEAW